MWFATGDGLNRYDGNAFVIYKHDVNDPGSLSHNFIRDLLEDDDGYLWVAAYGLIDNHAFRRRAPLVADQGPAPDAIIVR